MKLNLKNRINSKKVGSIMVGLNAEALKKMDLSHWWQQHIFVIKGRYHKGYPPMLYAAIVALGSLPIVAPFGCAQGKLYPLL
jgi:hypothetical protein